MKKQIITILLAFFAIVGQGQEFALVVRRGSLFLNTPRI